MWTFYIYLYNVAEFNGIAFLSHRDSLGDNCIRRSTNFCRSNSIPFRNVNWKSFTVRMHSIRGKLLKHCCFVWWVLIPQSNFLVHHECSTIIGRFHSLLQLHNHNRDEDLNLIAFSETFKDSKWANKTVNNDNRWNIAVHCGHRPIWTLFGIHGESVKERSKFMPSIIINSLWSVLHKMRQFRIEFSDSYFHCTNHEDRRYWRPQPCFPPISREKYWLQNPNIGI